MDENEEKPSANLWMLESRGKAIVVVVGVLSEEPLIFVRSDVRCGGIDIFFLACIHIKLLTLC